MITQCAGVRHLPARNTFEKAAADERGVYHRAGFTSDEGWLLPVVEQRLPSLHRLLASPFHCPGVEVTCYGHWTSVFGVFDIRSNILSKSS